MIKPMITNTILRTIIAIEENRYRISDCSLPVMVTSKLRKNSKKKAHMLQQRLRATRLQNFKHQRRLTVILTGTS